MPTFGRRGEREQVQEWPNGLCLRPQNMLAVFSNQKVVVVEEMLHQESWTHSPSWLCPRSHRPVRSRPTGASEISIGSRCFVRFRVISWIVCSVDTKATRNKSFGASSLSKSARFLAGTIRRLLMRANILEREPGRLEFTLRIKRCLIHVVTTLRVSACSKNVH